ncbi:autotransporter outer membrane beta-barrel domain-containing protein [Marinobacterium sediminicola]|uniref:Outer membrane autotransporter barrel domain-containing protein n=1 Tax=Marinobacterium sediminicola TaxID=518898 RepID=A0ABY1S235_9GAMM|nr:autotransporter outer membrane beta-barrel domain-containing protein [Marinobacterium sediminicola]ULG68526.1 autotransporter domain-containing protein [Marinobacterium sediminicola]SMR76639.1 outer membrane autotransporter barrel domain-containing protein [Marinobacterium sediminicola]
MNQTSRHFFPVEANGFRLCLLASAVMLASASMKLEAATGFTCGTETPTGSGDYILDQAHSGAIGTCMVNTDGDTITLTSNGEMTNAGGMAMRIDADNVSIDNSGTISSTSANFSARGLYANGASNLTINNNAGALINSDYGTALEITQSTGNPGSASVNNSGTIDGRNGIYTIGANDGSSNIDFSLNNSGTLQASPSPSLPAASGKALYLSYTDASSIVNSGDITSQDSESTLEVTFSSSVDNLENSGTISNTNNGRAIFVTQYGVNGSSSVNTLLNDGVISNHSYNNPTVHFVGSTLGSMTNNDTIRNTGGGTALFFAPQLFSGSGTVITNNGTIETTGNTAVFISTAADLSNFINSGTITGDFTANATNDLRLLTIAGNNSAVFNGHVDVAGADVVFDNGAVFTPLRYQSFLADNFNLSGGTLVLNPDAADRTAGSNLSVATPTITGDFSGSQGTLQVVVINDTSYGQLAVTGDVDLDQTTMHVDVRQNGLIVVGSTLDNVITATGNINYGSFNITDNSALFDFDTVRNTSDLDLILNSDGQGESTNSSGSGSGSGGGSTGSPGTPSSGNLITAVEEAGNTTAQGPAGVVQGFANDYANNQTTGNAQLDSAVQTLGTYATNEELANATATMAPASAATGQHAHYDTRQVNAVVGERIDYLHGLASGMSAGDEPASTGHVWLQPFGSWADQDTQDGVAGYDIDGYGLMMGMDTRVSTELDLGAAFSYARGQVDSKMPIGGYTTDVHSYQITGYLTKMIDSTTVLNTMAGLGYSDYKTHRTLFNSAQAQSNYNSWATNLNLELEKHYGLSDKANLAAILGAAYTYIDIDGYTETGAGALNLDVNGDSYSSLITSVGAELSYASSPNWLLITDASVGYDLLNERTTVTSAFTGGGATFTTQGIKPDAWVYDVGLGSKYTTDSGTEITAQYKLHGRENFQEQTVSVNMRWLF